MSLSLRICRYALQCTDQRELVKSLLGVVRVILPSLISVTKKRQCYRHVSPHVHCMFTCVGFSMSVKLKTSLHVHYPE